jgi:integrase
LFLTCDQIAGVIIIFQLTGVKKIDMTPEKKFFSPTLYPRSRDISKVWFIKYYVKDYAKGILSPRKWKGYLNHIQCPIEREAEAERVIQILENNELPPNSKGCRRVPASPLPPADWAAISRVIDEVLARNQKRFFTEPARIRFNNLRTKANTLKIWLQRNNLQKLTVGRLTTAHAKDFLQYLITEKKLTPHTRNHYKTDLSAIWKLMREDGIQVSNVWVDIPLEKSYHKSFSKHTAEVQQIIEQEMPKYDMQLYIAVQMIYGCFFRVIELSRLKLSAINWNTEIIHIANDVCYKSGSRDVPMTKPLIDAMKAEGYHLQNEDYYIFSYDNKPGNERLSYHFLRKKWDNFRVKFGIADKYKLYGLKHTGNINMSIAGINARTLQKLNGHHSLEFIQKNYTGELTLEDVMFVREHQPRLGEQPKPAINKQMEQTELLRQLLEEIKKLNATE